MEAFQRESVKHRSAGAEQRKRRMDVLSRQKDVRAAQMAQARGVAGSDELPPPPVEPAAPESGAMDTDASPSARQRRTFGAAPSAAERLMTAEWMVDVPSDLAHRWYVASRPAGKRVIVTTGGGDTRAQGRGKARTFPSALPGGCRGSKGAGAGTCELDCIFSEEEQVYYVLDLLRWKEQRIADCTAEFRLFWVHSKLGETRAHESASTNPCRFVPLPWVVCEPAALQGAYFFTAMPAGAKRDGLLFMHKEALYEPGASPLLLSWSDASCSRRFYDYGSQGMADAVQREPSKADRWRTAEIEAAVTFADLLRTAEQPGMEEDGALLNGGGGAPVQLLDAGMAD